MNPFDRHLEGRPPTDPTPTDPSPTDPARTDPSLTTRYPTGPSPSEPVRRDPPPAPTAPTAAPDRSAPDGSASGSSASGSSAPGSAAPDPVAAEPVAPDAAERASAVRAPSVRAPSPGSSATDPTVIMSVRPDRGAIVVSRATWASRVAAGAAPVVVAGLAALPYLAAPSVTRALVSLFALVVMASMWNLLAGYGGMISVGQQGFIGVGAYTVLAVDVAGVSPFLALPIAVVVAAALALPTTALVFRLSGGYFAIGTWVVAEVYRLVTVQIGAVGGGSGASLRGLTALNPVLRGAIVYWCALGAAVLAVAVVYAIMRSRFGLALTAIRDDPTAADSLGVRVPFAKRLVFVVAAGGCGLAGAVIVLDSLRVQPDSIYSVQWSAFMIFMVVIGGIGTIEGAVLGAIVFFVLQQLLEPYGVWYLVALGAVAITAALYARRGLWGLIAGRRNVHLLPTGYRVARRTGDPSRHG